MTHAFSSLDELGDGTGFRKVRKALGVTAFGVNGLVYPAGYEGFFHYHDTQDELYFVHKGRVRVEGRGANKTFTVRIKDDGGQVKELTYSLYRDDHGVMRVAPPGEEKGRKKK